MRCNIYAEEITQRVELVRKGEFTGIRFYLHLPVSLQTPPTKLGCQPGIAQVQGPFIHHRDDDDSAAVTFWGKREFKAAMIRALQLIEEAEGTATREQGEAIMAKLDSITKYPTAEELAQKFGHYFKDSGDKDVVLESVIRAIVQRTGGRLSE